MSEELKRFSAALDESLLRSVGSSESESAEPRQSLGEADNDADAVLAELARLRHELVDQTRHATTLAAKLALMARRERELRKLLLDAHDQLLRRDEELQIAIAAAMDPERLDGESRAAGPMLASSNVRYKNLINRIRELVEETLPRDATVAVVSRGDGELLELGDRIGWHLPQTNDGVYAGHHPRDSASAIDQLEGLKSKGAQFLLIPATALWWLEHYGEFAQHLDKRFKRVLDDESCVIFDLNARPESVRAPYPDYDGLVSRLRKLVDETAAPEATVAVVSRGDDALLALNGREAWHFPRDEDGEYAGYHPADTEAAIRQVEQIRVEGASHLIFPATAYWWLDHYAGLRRYLKRRYAVAARRKDACIIFDLQRSPGFLARAWGRLGWQR